MWKPTRAKKKCSEPEPPIEAVIIPAERLKELRAAKRMQRAAKGSILEGSDKEPA